MNEANNLLEQILQGYVSFHAMMKEKSLQHPPRVKGELAKYGNCLCQYLGVSRDPPVQKVCHYISYDQRFWSLVLIIDHLVLTIQLYYKSLLQRARSLSWWACLPDLTLAVQLHFSTIKLMNIYCWAETTKIQSSVVFVNNLALLFSVHSLMKNERTMSSFKVT